MDDSFEHSVILRYDTMQFRPNLTLGRLLEMHNVSVFTAVDWSSFWILGMRASPLPRETRYRLLRSKFCEKVLIYLEHDSVLGFQGSVSNYLHVYMYFSIDD